MVAEGDVVREGDRVEFHDGTQWCPALVASVDEGIGTVDVAYVANGMPMSWMGALQAIPGSDMPWTWRPMPEEEDDHDRDT